MDILHIIILSLMFNLLDFISGMIKGAKIEGIKSKKMRIGLYHKTAFILIYILIIAIHETTNYLKLPVVNDVVNVVCIYVILTEIVSIVENICQINPKLSQIKLLQILEVNKERKNNEDKKTN